jgi:hypothetical protein
MTPTLGVRQKVPGEKASQIGTYIWATGCFLVLGGCVGGLAASSPDIFILFPLFFGWPLVLIGGKMMDWGDNKKLFSKAIQKETYKN